MKTYKIEIEICIAEGKTDWIISAIEEQLEAGESVKSFDCIEVQS